jgi:ABC-type Na+ efflux pump permease subunit
MPGPVYADDIRLQARRRRRRRVVVAVVLGIVVAAYTYGALSERIDDKNDLLPPWLEAVLLGSVFALASLPVQSAIVARALIPFPTFLLYLTALVGKSPPLPYPAAFAVALAYAAALTALSSFLSERPERSKLGSRR